MTRQELINKLNMKKYTIYEINDRDRYYEYYANNEKKLVKILLDEFVIDWLREDTDTTIKELRDRFKYCDTVEELSNTIGISWYSLSIVNITDVDKAGIQGLEVQPMIDRGE